jgi:uncharacterized protein (DUF983 family)
MDFVKTPDALWRGFLNRCPCCGRGGLLHKFIIPYTACSSCGLDFAPLRSDDGPAWATVLLTGHLIVPFIFWGVESDLPTGPVTALLIALVLGMGAVILPRAKGVFMAVMWVTRVRPTRAVTPD